MKKMMTSWLAMMISSVVFAQGYAEHLAQAKQYESQKKWCHALGAYYDAMAADGDASAKHEAVESYKILKAAILAGNPGFGTFNMFTFHDEWKELLMEAEQYGSGICKYEITVGSLKQNGIDYSTRTASYSAEISFKIGNRYNSTIAVIADGYKTAYKSDWTDLPSNWPLYPAGHNVDGALYYYNDSYDGSGWVNAFEAEYDFNIRYSCEFNIVDESGRQLVKGERCLLKERQIIFTGIAPDMMDLIDNGNAFVNPSGCYLSGEHDETKIPLGNVVFICWNNKTDRQYVNVLKSRMHNAVASFQSEFTEVIMSSRKMQVQKTEMTQELYESAMGENPSRFKYEKNPVERVSWYDVIYFCNMLSFVSGYMPVYAVNGETDVEKWNYTPNKGESIFGAVTQNGGANGYRLPTVEEWQYAAKAGRNFEYAGSNDINAVAWYGGYKGNSGERPHEVATKEPNGYGLYDMSGNVWEWCWGSYRGGKDRYNCGGSWNDKSGHCTVDILAYCDADSQEDTIGFRLVRSVGE